MRLLLLAGTPEALQIAHAVSRERGMWAIVSLERSHAKAVGYHVPVRVGGFGGETGLRDWLTRNDIDVIVDATHPFATEISHRIHRVASDLNLPSSQFLRPAWRPGAQDNWHFLNAEEEAADILPGTATVLLSTGRRGLERFHNLGDRTVYVRLLERADAPFPFANGGYLQRPVSLPLQNEVAGLRALGIDWVVARNTGSAEDAPVVDAARLAGLPVGMIRRPAQPETLRFHTVTEVIAWLRRRRRELQ